VRRPPLDLVEQGGLSLSLRCLAASPARHRCTRREAPCLPSGIQGGDPQERNVTPVDLVQLGVLGWLSLAAMTVSSSWVNVDRSAFLCRYWRSSRLMFSLVPRCHGSK
jgi:hypothetical protein